MDEKWTEHCLSERCAVWGRRLTFFRTHFTFNSDFDYVLLVGAAGYSVIGCSGALHVASPSLAEHCGARWPHIDSEGTCAPHMCNLSL